MSATPVELVDFSQNGHFLNASIMASLPLHNLFTPFVSYARTNRAPNIHEIFATNASPLTLGRTYIDNYSVNTTLKPESANTYQVGFNSFYKGEIARIIPHSFGLKAVYYYSNIDDYINPVRELRRFQNVGSFTETTQTTFMYYNQDANMKGVELELNYDIGYVFIRGSYTYQDIHYRDPGEIIGANAADSKWSPVANEVSYTKPPRDYGNLDVGIRPLEWSHNRWVNDVVIGAIMKYTGESYRMVFRPISTNTRDLINAIYYSNTYSTTEVMPKIPTIWDIYVSVRFFERLNVRFEVQNVADENYVDALNNYANLQQGYRYPILLDNKARGRTYVLYLSLKF